MRYEWIWGIILPGKDKTYRKPLIFSLKTLRAIRQMFACMTGFETHKSSNSYRISGECKHITPFRLRCTRVFPSMFSRYYMGGSEVMGDSQSPTGCFSSRGHGIGYSWIIWRYLGYPHDPWCHGKLRIFSSYPKVRAVYSSWFCGVTLAACEWKKGVHQYHPGWGKICIHHHHHHHHHHQHHRDDHHHDLVILKNNSSW